jgi:hypothetical protein
MAWKHRLSEIDTVNKTAICSNCGPVKASKSGKFYRCRTALNEISRLGKYRRKYGTALLLEHPAKCDLCGGVIKIAYDHDHNTGKHRGWLCMKCNTALGLVNDDVALLKKMIEYLA